MAEERFRCEEKIAEYAERSGDYEHAEMLIRTANKCDIIDDDYRFKIDNIQYHTCFCKFRNPHMGAMLTLFSNYDKGLLPFPGSFVDQPAYIVEVFNILSKLKAEKEAENLKKENDGGRIDRHRTDHQSLRPGAKTKRR